MSLTVFDSRISKFAYISIQAYGSSPYGCMKEQAYSGGKMSILLKLVWEVQLNCDVKHPNSLMTIYRISISAELALLENLQ